LTTLTSPAVAAHRALTFSRVSRLIKTDDFSSVFNFRKRISGHFLAIHYLRNQIGHPRLGLIVAKKNTRSSVDRNYIRRVLRELFRKSQHELLNVDLVIRTQRTFGRADYKAVELEFDKLMVKLRQSPAPFAPSQTKSGQPAKSGQTS